MEMVEGPAKEKQRRYQRTCTQLRLKYPKLFDTFKCKPFKIGIHLDLEAENPDMSPKMIGRFLRFFTATEPYLIATVKMKKRVGLDSKPVETVSSEHQAIALIKLQAMQKRAA